MFSFYWSFVVCVSDNNIQVKILTKSLPILVTVFKSWTFGHNRQIRKSGPLLTLKPFKSLFNPVTEQHTGPGFRTDPVNPASNTNLDPLSYQHQSHKPLYPAQLCIQPTHQPVFKRDRAAALVRASEPTQSTQQPAPISPTSVSSPALYPTRAPAGVQA